MSGHFVNGSDYACYGNSCGGTVTTTVVNPSCPIWITSPSFTPEPLPGMAKTTKDSGILMSANGAIVSMHPTVAEAKDEARRLAAKNSEVYFVFKACGRIAPKPVDLDETDL